MFLTFSEAEPQKYRRHATMVLAVTSLLYGLELVFPEFLYGYGGISYAFREDATLPMILNRLAIYYTPIIQGILLIILSGDIIRTGNVLLRHIKGATLFFIVSCAPKLSFTLLEISAFGSSLFIEVFTLRLGEPLLRYSLIFTMIAFIYYVSMSILLEKSGYTKRTYFSLILYFTFSAINMLYNILTPPSSPLYQTSKSIYLIGFLLALGYFIHENRRVGALRRGIEDVHWMLRGAIFMFGFDYLVRLGFNLFYRFSTYAELTEWRPVYGIFLMLIFFVGASITVSSLLPWKIACFDDV